MSQGKTISPFKFLDSYTAADQEIFFGREREIEEAYSKVFQSDMLLVYGASGTGKSSLINCGLANKFQESDWLPIHIRRGGNIRRSMFEQIRKEAFNQVQLTEEEKLTNEGLGMVINSVFLDHFKPIFLIFDQFEELFIFGDKEEWSAFIDSVKFLLSSELKIQFIFVIRGEYLEFLSEFESEIPTFFDNRLRVEKMTRFKASRSISGPAEVFGISLDDGFEEELLSRLSPGHAQIELTFLQVFLDKIHRSASVDAEASEEVRFTLKMLDQMGQVGDVLSEFVDEQLFKMNDPKAALTVLKSFVSLQGTKVQMTLADVEKYVENLGQPVSQNRIDEIVTEFVNKRILNDKDDNGQYELRHDSLALKIFEKITHQERELLDVRQFIHQSLIEYEKRKVLLSDEDLAYIGPFERLLSLSTEEKEFISQSKKQSDKQQKSRRRKSIIAVVILALLATSIVALVYSQNQKALADEQRQIAQQESDEASRQRAIAEQQSEEARQAEDEAVKNARVAGEERLRALAASEEALSQRQEALRQKSIADQQRQQALQAQMIADQNAQEAMKSKALADAESQKALTLRMLSLARELAVKSSQMMDADLKGLLALKAFEFNLENGGRPMDPDVFTALYRAKKSLTPEALRMVKIHDLAVSAIANDGDITYTVSTDGQLNKIIWASETPDVTVLQDTEFAFQSIAVDESQIVAGTLFGELLISSKTGEMRALHKLSNASIEGVVINGNSIIAADASGSLHFLNMDGSVQSVKTETGQINSMVMDDDRLWTGGANGQLVELSMSGEMISMEKLGAEAITSLTTNGNVLIVGFQNGQILLWDRDIRDATQVLPGHSAAITDLKVVPGTDLLISSSYDRSVRVWQLNSPDLPAIVIQDRDHWITSVGSGPDGSYFLTGENDGSIRKFDLNPAAMAAEICTGLNRDLTQEEWTKYIGEDVPYQKCCGDE